MALEDGAGDVSPLSCGVGDRDDEGALGTGVNGWRRERDMNPPPAGDPYRVYVCRFQEKISTTS
jgi:hypothetical protein